MAEENAASSESAALPESLGVDSVVPNWTVAEYGTRHGRSLDGRRFAGMFSDGRSRTMTDRRGMRHDTDIGAWERRWATLRPWCAGVVDPAWPFDMPFVRHVDEVAYVRRLYEVFRKYREEAIREEELDWLSLCCLDVPYDKFYLVRDAADWWRELDFERRQRINVRGRRFVGWHNLEMFAIPPRERDSYYQAVEDIWVESEGSRSLGIATPVVFSYMTERLQSGTALERDLLPKVAEVEYHVLSLGAFLRCVRYGPIERLSYPRMVSGCEGWGVLLYVPYNQIRSWYALGVCRLLRNMAVDPVLALIAIARVTEIDWQALEDQEWFPYNYEGGRIITLPAEPPLVRRSASGVEVREGGHPEIRPKYREGFADRGMSMEYARLVWRRYLASGIDLTKIPTLEEQDALTRPASPIDAAVAEVEEPEDEQSGGHADNVVPDEEEDWTIGDLIEVDAAERVGVKRRLRDLQETCRVKKRKVPGSVSEAVGLAVELVDDAVAGSPGAGSSVQPRIDELTQELSRTRGEVVSLTSKVDELEGERTDAKRLNEEAVKKLRAEATASQERMEAERNDALSRYHGVLRSIRGIVKAADERHAGHSDTLANLRLLFEEGRKVKAVGSSAGPSLEAIRVVELESALEAKELKLQTLPGLASENSTLRAEVNRLRASVETLGREKREIVMLTQDVRDLTSRSAKIRAEAENLRKRNIELTGEVRERDARSTVESARRDALAEELAKVKSELAAVRAEGANSRWSAHGVASSASRVEDDVTQALMAISGEVAEATKRRVAIIGLELRNALKRVSTHIEMESQAAVARIRTELEGDDSEALRSVAACRALLHNRVADVRRNLPDTTESVVGFDSDFAVTEPEQAKDVDTEQASKKGQEASGTKDQK